MRKAIEKKMFLILLVCAALSGWQSCGNSAGEGKAEAMSSEDAAVTDSSYRVVMDLGEVSLPFWMDISFKAGRPAGATLRNGEEAIPVRTVRQQADSIYLDMPVFDASIHLGRSARGFSGTFFNHARRTHREIPVEVQRDAGKLFSGPDRSPTADLDGKWEVEFVYQGQDTSQAMGLFEQKGNVLSGTFRTPTGDYRYLAGEVRGDSLLLSCFDGAHAFLFKAGLQPDGSLRGSFWSGTHWYEEWTAWRNPDFELPDPDALTRMKPGEERLDFAFPDVGGHVHGPSQPAYLGKPLVVQVMGTWCPNCKDETALLKRLHADYGDRGLEIIAVALEVTPDSVRAMDNLRRLQAHFDLAYPVVYGGRAGRETASAALPALEHVMSYPTTIFMDADHRVRRIYTGFSGPATGAAYDKLVSSFESTVMELLASQEGG